MSKPYLLGAVVSAGAYRPADGTVRRWSCPKCGVKVDTAEPPAGWSVFRPFDRVAACDLCSAEVLDQLQAEGILR